MIITKKVVEEHEVIADVTCDRCGKSCMTDYGPEAAEISCSFGYSSKSDGLQECRHLCEPCYHWVIELAFNIPNTPGQ